MSQKQENAMSVAQTAESVDLAPAMHIVEEMSPVTSGDIIPLLQRLQDAYGYLPKEIRVATFLHKPDATVMEVKLDYVGIKIPNDFILGYGLDYDGYGRNFKERSQNNRIGPDVRHGHS